MSNFSRAVLAGAFALALASPIIATAAHGETSMDNRGVAAPAPQASPPASAPSATAPAYSESGQGVKAASRAAEAALGECSQDDLICIADALDRYAGALRNLAPPLAPELQKLPDIVSRAARRVRQAKTRAQATAALKAAIGEVRKTIALLKADDPVLLKAETRQGAFVAETLDVAKNKLEKAVGL